MNIILVYDKTHLPIYTHLKKAKNNIIKIIIKKNKYKKINLYIQHSTIGEAILQITITSLIYIYIYQNSSLSIYIITKHACKHTTSTTTEVFQKPKLP